MPGQRFTAVEMIEKLVSFDTTSRDSNLPLIEFVEDYLKGHGVASTRIPDETGKKANLYATIGPKNVPGIVLSGHTDVVPVDGQPWVTDPFKVVEKEGRLYGRGTADMKSFSAVGLSMVPKFVERPLKTPIHFALSYDEEVGCLGAPRMIAQLEKLGVRPKIVIVGEPTDMTVVNAHKGVHSFRTELTGLEQHSSATHLGVNAVMYAADIIHFLSGLAEEWKATRSQPGSGFEPPYTTIHVGTIQGGTAQNIIPRHCVFTWEYRLIPGDDGAEIRRRFDDYVEGTVLPKMRAVWPEAGVQTVPRASVPGLMPEDGSPAEALCLALARTNEVGVVSYGTEAGQFQEAGISTVICGPGSIAQAHKPNEFIELSQVRKCEDFMQRLLDEVCRG
ncbi:MAG: acetylornithine deacetylase [Alphaproteobacteria bacterium]